MSGTNFGGVQNGAVGISVTYGAAVAYGQIVKCGTDGRWVPGTASAGNLSGVAQSAGAEDDVGTVVFDGPVLVQVAAINFASETQYNCTCNSDGRAVPVSSNGQAIIVRLIPGTTTQLNYAAGDLCLGVIASGTAHA
jgi:hypothetical protein